MKDNKLVVVGKDNIFLKISKFIKSIFKKDFDKKININENTHSSNENNDFRKSIQEYQNEDSDIIVLKKLYHEGKISVKDLSDKQLIRISELYDENIFRLKEKNKKRKEKLLQYRNAKMKKA